MAAEFKWSLVFYTWLGILGGVGIGVITSNIYPLNFWLGIIITAFSLGVSIYVWHSHKEIQEAFKKS